MDITSLQNPRVKHIVKLRDDKRERQHEGLMLVEGWDEITLALTAGYQPETLLTAPELAARQLEHSQTEVITVERAVFEKMSFRENPDGWLAVFPIPKHSLDDLKLSDFPLLIVAESIEKPGNLGAILRTADTAAVEAVLLCDPRVDLYNPNVVRASPVPCSPCPVWKPRAKRHWPSCGKRRSGSWLPHHRPRRNIPTRICAAHWRWRLAPRIKA